MNRIAMKIKEARQKAKMTEKELAKKCGLSEGYIIQIESGRKVINEKAAENILSKLGERIDFGYEEAFREEVPKKPQADKEPSKPREEFYPIQPTEQWSDALANIIKKYPVYDIETNKIVGHRNLPVIGKKVEGYHWDRLSFVQAADNSMEALRIKKGDVIMIYTANEIENSSLYFIEMNRKRIIRQLRREANNKVVLSTGANEAPVVTELSNIRLIGKCVKVEFQPGPKKQM
ncbi:helix-turn-helix transcriptional regulator [Alkaliphilus crotonatoxidans]